MRSIRFAALAAVYGLIAACATTPQVTTQALDAAAGSGGSVQMFGTLAPLGSFEWKASPSYTRLAVARHNAAQAVHNKSLSVDAAFTVLNLTDAARKALDDAVTADANKQPVKAELLLSAATVALTQAEAILGGGL